eukprot:scaffold124883_cov36-Attheya_sp.AAC.2
MDEGEGFNAPLACFHRKEWTKLTSLRSLCEGHVQDMDAVEEKQQEQEESADSSSSTTTTALTKQQGQCKRVRDLERLTLQ